MILIALVIFIIGRLIWSLNTDRFCSPYVFAASLIALPALIASLFSSFSNVDIAFQQPLIRYKAYSVDNGTQINGKITKGFIYMSGFVNEKFVYRVLVGGADDTYQVITIGADSTKLVFDDNKTPGVYVGGKRVQALNKFGKIVFYPFSPKEHTRHYINQYLILPKNAKPIGFELM